MLTKKKPDSELLDSYEGDLPLGFEKKLSFDSIKKDSPSSRADLRGLHLRVLITTDIELTKL